VVCRGGDHLLGVEGGVRSKNRGEGGVLTGGLGLPFSLRCQAHRTNRKEIFEDLWMHREISSRSLPPLGRFAREIRERGRRFARLG
jgi:hypothetical protein